MNDQGNLPVSKNMVTSLTFAIMLLNAGKDDVKWGWVYVVCSSVLVAGYMFKDYLKHKNDAK